MKTIINDPAQLLNHRRISIQLVLIPGGSEDDSSALASEQKLQIWYSKSFYLPEKTCKTMLKCTEYCFANVLTHTV